MTCNILPASEVAHAVFTTYPDADTGAEMPGLAAVRYYRFGRPVELNGLRIHPTFIRWAPPVLSRPRTITIAILAGNIWKTVVRKKLDAVPPAGGFHLVKLPKLRAAVARLTCDDEHPVEPSHGEQWANPKIVPFRIIEKVEWLGRDFGDKIPEAIYHPPLKQGHIAPKGGKGLKVEDTGTAIRFRSDFLLVAFCKRRPLLTEFGWDAFGKRWNNTSLLPQVARETTRWPSQVYFPYLFCGPVFRGIHFDVLPRFWGGRFEVDGNRVRYRNLMPMDGLKLDVEFTVFADGLDLAIRQQAERDLLVLEYSSWFFPWDGEKSLVGMLGLPDRSKGRTGIVSPPAYWNAPGHGALLVRQVGGEPAWLQVDSWRKIWMTFCGVATGVRHDEYGLATIQRGAHEARLSIRPQPILPRPAPGLKLKDVPEGIRRHWATAFPFRPELAGFGNSHLSCNCHMSQAGPCDLATRTQVTPGAPNMMDLARYTIEFAVRGGPGYGDVRDLYLDSDPVLVYSAARLHNAEPAHPWGRANWPFILRATQRTLSLIDKKGLVCCRTLSGNSGSHRWSCNAWDVVSFGHYDAYVNALAYQAFRELETMARSLDDAEVASSVKRAADGIKARYLAAFYNPKTGWLGGWRSRDGELHDYCFVFINCLAIAVGLVEGVTARKIMAALERTRKVMGLDHFRYGMASSLEPIGQKDLPFNPSTDGMRADGWDQFGSYVNGSLTTVFSDYYVTALDKCGLRGTTDQFIRDLNQTLISNEITRAEFFTWEGFICGYEGVLVGCYRVLLPMLKHLETQRSFQPPA